MRHRAGTGFMLRRNACGRCVWRMTERTGRGAPSLRVCVCVCVQPCTRVALRRCAAPQALTAQMRRYAQTEALVSDMLDEICGDERIWATYKTVRCGPNAC